MLDLAHFYSRTRFARKAIVVAGADYTRACGPAPARLTYPLQRTTCLSFAVSFDGKVVIRAVDDTFPDAGKVGLGTKADSLTLFDDFSFGGK